MTWPTPPCFAAATIAPRFLLYSSSGTCRRPLQQQHKQMGEAVWGKSMQLLC